VVVKLLDRVPAEQRLSHIPLDEVRRFDLKELVDVDIRLLHERPVSQLQDR